MTVQRPPSELDPLEQVMATVVEGFRATTAQIKEHSNQLMVLQQQNSEKEDQIKQLKRAAYQGLTGAGKTRYVKELVEDERKKNPTGAQSRVAGDLDLTPGRVSQLLNSEKNRKNGK